MRPQKRYTPKPQARYKPNFLTNDPARYQIQNSPTGECKIIDVVTGKPLAQLDTRAEADSWIENKVSG